VIGFAPPEPARYLRLLETDPRLAPQWRSFLRVMPAVFARAGATWVPGLSDGQAIGCAAADFPDSFHSDAACSARVRERLDAAAR
jgi:hypothetical protein